MHIIICCFSSEGRFIHGDIALTHQRREWGWGFACPSHVASVSPQLFCAPLLHKTALEALEVCAEVTECDKRIKIHHVNNVFISLLLRQVPPNSDSVLGQELSREKYINIEVATFRGPVLHRPV